MSMELPTPFSGGYGGGYGGGFGGYGGGWQSQNPFGAELAGGLGGIGAGLASLFLTQNPADASSPWLSQIPDALKQYLMPYINAGQTGLNDMNQYVQRGNTAGNTLMGQYGNLLANPAGVMNQMGSQFKQSPGYGFQVSQALQAANNAAAAGGMAGSPQEQQQIAGITNQLANQDYYNYLGKAMGLYGQGLQGMQDIYGIGGQMGQDIFNTGAQSANDLAGSLASYYMSQANNAYAGAINQNQNQIGGIGELLGGIGSLFGL